MPTDKNSNEKPTRGDTSQEKEKYTLLDLHWSGWFMLAIFLALVIMFGFITCGSYKTIYGCNYSHKTDTVIINYVPVADTSLQAKSGRDREKFVTAKIDSLEKVVNHIDDQYQSNIDINLEKINGWIGFWLALISIIVAITAFWQIYKQHKLEEEASKVKDNLNKEVKDAIDVLDNKISENEARLKRMAIIHLAQSIAQIPDPRYVPGPVEKKTLCKQFLSSLCDALSEYINALNIDISDDAMLSEANFQKMEVMLVHLGYATTMVLSIYTNRSVNVKLTKIRDDINDLIQDTNGNGRDRNSIIKQLKNIHTELIEITKE